MSTARNWAGVRQGSLFITRRVGVRQDGQALWETKCDCGTVSVKASGSLRQGTKSCSAACGVSKSNRARAKHGYARGKEHQAWQNAKQRCFNPDHPGYENYGARGITMCKEWAEDFSAFLRDVGPAPGSGRQISLDRIDNEGHYEPGNVRWVQSVKTQLRNQRRNMRTVVDGKEVAVIDEAERLGLPYSLVSSRWRKGMRGADLFAPKQRATEYTLYGETLTLPQWAKRFGVSEGTVRTRMGVGETLEEALQPGRRKMGAYKYKPRPPKRERPKSKRTKYFTINGVTKTANQWATHYGIQPSTMSHRLRKGWSIEEAIKPPKKT